MLLLSTNLDSPMTTVLQQTALPGATRVSCFPPGRARSESKASRAQLHQLLGKASRKAGESNNNEQRPQREL